MESFGGFFLKQAIHCGYQHKNITGILQEIGLASFKGARHNNFHNAMYGKLLFY